MLADIKRGDAVLYHIFLIGFIVYGEIPGEAY